MQQLKELTYLQINIFLGVGGIIFFVLFYFFSIQDTIVMYREYNKLTKQVATAVVAPKEIQVKEKELAIIEAGLGNLGGDKYSQEELLKIVSTFCKQNKITLREFPQAEATEENDYTIYTIVMETEGDYTAMLKLAYNLEQIKRAGRIASLVFETKKDRITRRSYLSMQLFLQTIKT